MNPAKIRLKLKRRRARRDRQKRLYEKTGRRGHKKAARVHQRAVKKLRTLLDRLTTVQPVSNNGIRFIAEFEGFYSKPYNDPVGFATVGYGHLIRYGPVKASDHTSVWLKGQRTPGRLTEAEARKLLKERVAADYSPPVRALFTDGPLKGKFHQGALDALVSFAFNLGPASVQGVPGFETIGRAIESGSLAQIAQALPLYDKAGGQALAGLTRRRKAEAHLLLTGMYHY